MNKYQKIIDYDKNEAHYFCNEYGIVMKVSKDIIIDELQERINKAIKYINKFYDKNEEVIDQFGFALSYKYIKEILEGEVHE